MTGQAEETRPLLLRCFYCVACSLCSSIIYKQHVTSNTATQHQHIRDTCTACLLHVSLVHVAECAYTTVYPPDPGTYLDILSIKLDGIQAVLICFPPVTFTETKQPQ